MIKPLAKEAALEESMRFLGCQYGDNIRNTQGKQLIFIHRLLKEPRIFNLLFQYDFGQIFQLIRISIHDVKVFRHIQRPA